jgi:hypothetical protein
MKKILVLSLLMGVLAITAISCRKVTKTHPEFVGFWSASDGSTVYVIEIKDDGEGRYQESSSVMSSNKWEGPARYKNGTLKIGIKKLSVDKEPFQVSGNNYMEVEGKTFIRQ